MFSFGFPLAQLPLYLAVVVVGAVLRLSRSHRESAHSLVVTVPALLSVRRLDVTVNLELGHYGRTSPWASVRNHCLWVV